MPVPLALIGAGIGAAAQIGGNLWQNRQNRRESTKQRDWNKQQQLQQQRFDLKMWNRANEYNSPQSQMARFKQAGLNPHLIYGKGTAGNTSPIKSPDIKPYSRPEMQSVTRGLDAFGDYHRFKQLSAQTNNLKANTSVADQTALLTAQKTAGQVITNARGRIQQTLERKLAPYQAEGAAVALEQAYTNLRKSNTGTEILDRSRENRIK